jgi:8-oxo-dGTP diphosphatase
MMGFILWILSLILSIILLPLGVIVGFVTDLYNHHIGIALTNIDNKFHKIAVSLDIHGNVVCGELFNLILITKNGHPFGSDSETISFCVGVNKDQNTLSKLGKLVYNILIKFKDPLNKG